MISLTDRLPAYWTRRVFPFLALSALFFGLWSGLQQPLPEEQPALPVLLAGTTLSPPRPLEPFALTAHDGQPFNLERLRGQWTFLSIGYTQCPDVCPTTLATFDAIARQSEDLNARPGFVFVSVDPERDTLEQLGHYVTYFNPAFLGATGSHAQLQGLSRQLGQLYGRVEEPDSALDYLVDHSASVLLLDPQGRLSAVFTPPHDPTDMARDFRLLSGQ